MSQIAEKAGVSRSTVGHVLNGRATALRISKQTSDRIEQVARDLNYIANPLARGLRGGQTQAIGILWSLGGPHASDSIIRPLCAMLNERDYISYILDHDADPVNLIANLKNLLSRGADGIVLEMGAHTDLANTPQVTELIRSFRLRVLVTVEPIEFDADIVIHDRQPAVREAVTHLLTSGRRHLVYAAGGIKINQHKADAVIETVAEFGHGATADLVDLRKATSAQSVALFDTFPALDHADAVLLSNDEYAIACLRWMEKTGRRCPDDVAVVGFNNSEFSQFFTPTLATVDRSYPTLIEQIEELVENRLSNPKADYQTRYAPMKFVPRESAENPNRAS